MADPIDEAEAEIRAVFWAALSRWLVQLARRVLRSGARPDPDAVWSMRPAWDAVVEQMIERAILPIMQRVYASVLGRDYPWDQRVFLGRHLAEVRNRMARTPDEVYDLIASEMAEGVNLGDSIPELAARVEQTLDATGTDRWENRATVVARTEAIGALNAARLDAFNAVAEDEGGAFEKVWVATVDSRTRETHREADGQRVPLDQPFTVGGYPLMFPGDPRGPAQEVISCRCSFVLVEQGEAIDYSDRQMRQ